MFQDRLLLYLGLVAAVRSVDLEAKWGTEWPFSGITTFAHLPHEKCILHPTVPYDIGIIGVPFDTAVSYRSGARFGPRAIRSASARQTSLRGYNPRASFNPYMSWATVLDCGDIPVSPFDKTLALRQMTEAFEELMVHPAAVSKSHKPRLLTLGGDHSIALATLRALVKLYGHPINVLHFDAHLDTWSPVRYPSYWLDSESPLAEQASAFNHGSMFWMAAQEGLIGNRSVHAGLRCRLSGDIDNIDDTAQGWTRIHSDAVSADELGPKGVAKVILDRMGSEPVYLSIDIDVIDPGMAPGTGTPEPGGWSTRELIRVLRGIEGLNVVGADIVEVAPAYDGAGEQTALAAAQVAFELLTSMVKQREDLVKLSERSKAAKDEL